MGGPLSVVEGFSLKFEHPKSTAYYFSLSLILSVAHVSALLNIPCAAGLWVTLLLWCLRQMSGNGQGFVALLCRAV